MISKNTNDPLVSKNITSYKHTPVLAIKDNPLGFSDADKELLLHKHMCKAIPQLETIYFSTKDKDLQAKLNRLRGLEAMMLAHYGEDDRSFIGRLLGAFDKGL